MGRPDQLLKYMLELEAPIATHDAATFKRAPEIATTEITPDGLLLATMPGSLADLPAPWCLLQREAVVDGKMPGDHLDPPAAERCLWRRQARQVQRIEREGADPRPGDCSAWIIAPHVPEWIGDWQMRGWIDPHPAGPGCLTVQQSLAPMVWIAANELPLHEALIPFLLVRSGQKLKEFIRWVIHARPPEWLSSVVRSLPEVAAMMPEFKPDLSADDQRRVVEGLRKSVMAYPEAASDLVEQGRKQQGLTLLAHQCERRLRRALTEAERRSLAARIDHEDAIVLNDQVLDLTVDELVVWLAASGAG